MRPASRRCARYIAADLSFGMLVGLAPPVPDRINLDATRIPIAGNIIDVVLANHMLYHISELRRAIEEIYRVLHPPGVLIAATNSENYMPELAELQVKVARRLGIDKREYWQDPLQFAHTFSLESGHLFLESFFQAIERYDLPGALVFPKSEPVIDYLASMQERFQVFFPKGIIWDDVVPVIQAELDEHIKRHGEFRVHKRTGVFICRKVS
jgi:SAM-dependent methyltransferase